MLTGYAANEISGRSLKITPLADRPIVVGYRGRDIGAYFGRLAFLKYEIGRKLKEVCIDSGRSPTTLPMDEESRIYGNRWFDFIGSCRVMLGTESASNVFDWDGSIEILWKKMSAGTGKQRSLRGILTALS